MKVINVKRKDGGAYNVFFEMELDNGEFIFYNDYLISVKCPENGEELKECYDEERHVSILNQSIIDKIDTPEEEEVWCHYDEYLAKDRIGDVAEYSSYLKLVIDTLLGKSGCKVPTRSDDIEREHHEEFKLLRKLMIEYWKDTEDAKDGTIDIDTSYEEWVGEYIYELLETGENIKEEVRGAIKTYLKWLDGIYE